MRMKPPRSSACEISKIFCSARSSVSSTAPEGASYDSWMISVALEMRRRRTDLSRRMRQW